jgi:hypothetical protein
VPIFTDRRCGDLGATPRCRRPARSAGTLAASLRVRTCARNQDALLGGVRAALENHDANRLADYYHWTGMGSTEGYRLMERLDAFSARPVVDVQLVRSAPPSETTIPGGSTRRRAAAALRRPMRPPIGRAPRRPPAPAARCLAAARGPDAQRPRTSPRPSPTSTCCTNAGCWWMRF